MSSMNCVMYYGCHIFYFVLLALFSCWFALLVFIFRYFDVELLPALSCCPVVLCVCVCVAQHQNDTRSEAF